MNRRRSALVIATVLIGVAPRLQAQRAKFGAEYHATNCGASFASQTPLDLAPTPCITADDVPGILHFDYSFAGAARATYNSLGASAAFSYSGDVSGLVSWSGGPRTYVTVGTVDNLTFGGGSGSGVFRVTQTLHGSFANDAANIWGTSDFVSSITQLEGGAGTFYSYGEASTTFPGSHTSVMDFAFTFGESRIFTQNLEVGAGWPGGYATGPFSHSATADFLNSADFTYAVLDDQLRPISGATVVGSDGYSYVEANQVTAAPEPSALALVAIGLAVVLGSRPGYYRQRRT
jgi:hypothetical protein